MQLAIGRSVRYICISILLIFVFVAALTFYMCSGRTCSLDFLNSPYRSVRLRANRQLLPSKVVRSDFDIRGSDVIVFLHIQNTGGSVFARHIVEDLQLRRPCRCKQNRRLCRCYRPNNYGSTWFFSRYTTGWKCGVHPDWSELTTCVDRVMDEDEGKPVKRRYFFVTMLRDPVKRFLSEFWHVHRGQGWPEATACFERNALANLTLDAFSKCPQVINRQTRMLADMALIRNHNSSREERDLILLTSAQNNLRKMSFFGLSEFPRVSQYVFEATFGLFFREGGVRDAAARKRRRKEQQVVGARDVEAVGQLNNLDAQLYRYAQELLFARFERLKGKEEDPALFEGSNNRTTDWAEEDIMAD